MLCTFVAMLFNLLLRRIAAATADNVIDLHAAAAHHEMRLQLSTQLE